MGIPFWNHSSIWYAFNLLTWSSIIYSIYFTKEMELGRVENYKSRVVLLWFLPHLSWILINFRGWVRFIAVDSSQPSFSSFLGTFYKLLHPIIVEGEQMIFFNLEFAIIRFEMLKPKPSKIISHEYVLNALDRLYCFDNIFIKQSNFRRQH